ncbi:MAG: OmpA family protein [Candidatus Electrothrix sp. AX5]|jgi:outer membrane protein OmpA-like peptidoglycan-associated protein|uniref:OmpA family protein n=1 Tax=Candidatus Electrothrix aarhusensis TaxID=1859131 RepID=A0A444IS58_9BACT|nr:OmpA family protein [Candidatus Electrothrix sp. AX5]RWX43728.1 OmpA family protein [Candidatus Electrothrix aarhusensis]
MHIFSRLLPAFFITVLLFGCADQKIKPSPAEGKDLFVLLPDQNGKVGEITISNKAGSTTLSEANESAQVTSNNITTRTEILSDRDIQENFHDTLQAIPGTADQYILFFSSGTIKLTRESQKQLPLILKRIKERLPCEISIIGHSDTEAGSEYNLSLALKRAIHVKDKLLSIGAPRKLLEVSSHGENDPMIPTKDDVAEPQNRRVEIFIR